MPPVSPLSSNTRRGKTNSPCSSSSSRRGNPSRRSRAFNFEHSARKTVSPESSLQLRARGRGKTVPPEPNLQLRAHGEEKPSRRSRAFVVEPAARKSHPAGVEPSTSSAHLNTAAAEGLRPKLKGTEATKMPPRAEKPTRRGQTLALVKPRRGRCPCGL